VNTFFHRDFENVVRMHSVPNEGRTLIEVKNKEKYFKLSFGEPELGRANAISFESSECPQKQVARVTCKDLECGVRPQATSQWARSVTKSNRVSSPNMG